MGLSGNRQLKTEMGKSVLTDFPIKLLLSIIKVEPTHGTPPAAGIASFRSATTKYNIPSKTKAVKCIFSGINSLCVFICSYSVKKIFILTFNRLLRLILSCIQIIQMLTSGLYIIIMRSRSISNDDVCHKPAGKLIGYKNIIPCTEQMFYRKFCKFKPKKVLKLTN